jgi:hypothetical protein
MSHLLIRRFVAVLMFVAFLGAGVAQAMPAGQMGMTDTMSSLDKTGTTTPCKIPGPCKDAGRLCAIATGCLVSSNLPADTSQSMMVRLSWSTVPYWTTSGRISGRAPEPAIGPPIQFV